MHSSVLQVAWQRWKIISELVGDLHARAITLLFYFTVLVPFGVGARLLGDPIDLKTTNGWLQRTPVSSSLEDAQRQS
ncbi:MAG: hypothetical protein CUN55_12345 [Phototrophicales bacterium]|nr:MAG: hypothetical protein CUN55_12345 [Phototrophicales bacterium]